ncbi:MAG TPA: amidophosphoribosyltransferase [Bacteroidales bacterium]|nr:amidophosphoribosyltransferase [Bacteroidales bacterium]HOR60102.1 amidophosphoribosyltransferase [Bacteroidales bacterium]HPL05584.1 amidophosphoribosyltransferase [Bacteroidales bacterium]
MSDQIKHECGIALMRLRKPLSYYQEKYGTWRYGVNKLYLLMEKQHNRGQDGAGILGLKLNMPAGLKYMHRKRSVSSTPIIDCFNEIYRSFDIGIKSSPEKANDANWAKQNLDFVCDLYMGHLRYASYGKDNIDYVHPLLRVSNWRSKTLALAGNFNLTNVDELFQYLIEFGQHPKECADTVTALELIGLFMEEENQKLFREYKNQGYKNYEITNLIEENIDIAKVLREATASWDGAYVMGGITGHGDSFLIRDPGGIRPAFYYYDDEIFVAASERPAIQTALNITAEQVHELDPGMALIIKKNGTINTEMIKIPEKKTPCSFERIYFSRGTDHEIYKERKKLGELLVPTILKAINYDFENTVFSFIPNTAETAFYGMLKGLETHLNEYKTKQIREKVNAMTDEEIRNLLELRPRVEKIAVKDVKMRTFITQDKDREEMVKHVYDITYKTINKKVDTLVIIDDSIVRGTTLRQSILKILDRLEPKKIIIVSSAPQVRYPDCYGIDLPRIGDFIAFQAAIALAKENNKEDLIKEVYQLCKEQENLPKEDVVNYVRNIYKEFSAEQISQKIAELIKNDSVNAEFQVIYQTIEDLHKACPNNHGDWYFTGNYPTPGGNKVVTHSFIDFYEKAY